MRNTFLTSLVLLLFVPAYASNYNSFFSKDPGLLSGAPPALPVEIGQFEQIQKINIYFSIGAYPFKMPDAYNDGELTSITEIGPTIGFDFPVDKNNFGMKFTFFDGKPNVEQWEYQDVDNPELNIFLLDFYAMRQYNLIQKLDAYVQLGLSIKMIRGSFVKGQSYTSDGEEYLLDYSTLGIAGEIGLKYRLLKHLAIKTGYYQSIMFKGSHIGYFPFIGFNVYF